MHVTHIIVPDLLGALVSRDRFELVSKLYAVHAVYLVQKSSVLHFTPYR